MTKNVASIPPVPENSFRITVHLDYAENRMDKILLKALQEQSENEELKKTTRSTLKALFAKGRVMIKGQVARPASSLAKGVTYIDIKL
ncbi:MAG: hypothetical protein QE271_07535 [Bacteriovoracaceae bacterium]|nr:hypothetical protein [Bacteriovoracaceae bacterium]